MIDLHYWPTPNGKKVTILLEECGLPYRIVPCRIGQGDQFKDEFLRTRDAWGLANVEHRPLEERRMLVHMLSGADVVLVSQMAEVVDIVVPSKLVTALGAGAMVVAACAPESETARLIGASDGGLLVPAGDDAALASVIRRIRAGEVPTAAYRRRAREFALRYFDRRAVYGPLADAHVAAVPFSLGEGAQAS